MLTLKFSILIETAVADSMGEKQVLLVTPTTLKWLENIVPFLTVETFLNKVSSNLMYPFCIEYFNLSALCLVSCERHYTLWSILKIVRPIIVKVSNLYEP